jgi:hypothetical protein
MAYYLVRAKPRRALLKELEQRLTRGEFVAMRPFGAALSHSLHNARFEPDGNAVWEEEDYCRPPLAERAGCRARSLFRELENRAGEREFRLEGDRAPATALSGVGVTISHSK